MLLLVLPSRGAGLHALGERGAAHIVLEVDMEGESVEELSSTFATRLLVWLSLLVVPPVLFPGLCGMQNDFRCK